MLAALVLGLLAIGSAACGPKVIDDDKAEELIRLDLESAGVVVERVECPTKVAIEAGERFECEVTDGDGEVAIVTLRMVDDEGRVRTGSIELAEPAESSGNGSAEGR